MSAANVKGAVVSHTRCFSPAPVSAAEIFKMTGGPKVRSCEQKAVKLKQQKHSQLVKACNLARQRSMPSG
jgi:hypothetical protein